MQRDSRALLGNGPSLVGLSSLEHGCPVPGSLRAGGLRLSGCGSSASLPPMNRRSTIPAESVTWKCGGNTTKGKAGGYQLYSCVRGTGVRWRYSIGHTEQSKKQ